MSCRERRPRSVLATIARHRCVARAASDGPAFWAETAAIVNDIAAAEELGGLLEPLAGRLMDGGVNVWDTVDRIRALLRLTTGAARFSSSSPMQDYGFRILAMWESDNDGRLEFIYLLEVARPGHT